MFLEGKIRSRGQASAFSHINTALLKYRSDPKLIVTPSRLIMINSPFLTKALRGYAAAPVQLPLHPIDFGLLKVNSGKRGHLLRIRLQQLHSKH